MVYSVTGVAETPHSAFRSESRHTAQGARDLAATYLSSGLREVEIRDGEGNLQSLRDLERKAARDGSYHAGSLRRSTR